MCPWKVFHCCFEILLRLFHIPISSHTSMPTAFAAFFKRLKTTFCPLHREGCWTAVPQRAKPASICAPARPLLRAFADESMWIRSSTDTRLSGTGSGTAGSANCWLAWSTSSKSLQLHLSSLPIAGKPAKQKQETTQASGPCQSRSATRLKLHSNSYAACACWQCKFHGQHQPSESARPCGHLPRVSWSLHCGHHRPSTPTAPQPVCVIGFRCKWLLQGVWLQEHASRLLSSREGCFIGRLQHTSRAQAKNPTAA